MHDKQRKPDEALTELRRRLSDWLATSGLDKTQLARRTGMGRTTVSEAFQTDGPVPSARTLAALAMALGRPTEELLKLRRTAVTEEAEPADEKGPGPGRPIDRWEPHDLEVHPAGIALCEADLPRQQQLPSYVPREHDRTLAEAVRQVQADRSRMVVLSGTSSTGKTRACWEAIRPLARAGWKLWHPFDPTRAEGALKELSFVRPRTVIWLNEAQHYLGDMHVGEQIAAALHALLTDEARMPVLVLGTLWPEYAREYTALPATGRPDPYSRARELLAGRTVSVPEGFDAESLAAAARLAQGGDRLLADALTRADTHGRVTQDLAGAPELLRRYENGSPAAQALLQAAMDARRLRVGLHLPQAFLIDGATGYLTDTDYDNLADGWAQAAFAELAEQVHGKQAPCAASPSARRTRCTQWYYPVLIQVQCSGWPTTSNSTGVRADAWRAHPPRSGRRHTLTSRTQMTWPTSPMQPMPDTARSGRTTSGAGPSTLAIRTPIALWSRG
ncbi:transcriptional regulator with XRE-family HTH domain [Streptomyces sp. HB372]|nr:transcriptional regulator with XRE-family HTH domain [Streptomyces sp. HB372]